VFELIASIASCIHGTSRDIIRAFSDMLASLSRNCCRALSVVTMHNLLCRQVSLSVGLCINTSRSGEAYTAGSGPEAVAYIIDRASSRTIFDRGRQLRL
jgi:hypothetical protein